MRPEHVELDPDDPLDPGVFLCSTCGRIWTSMTAAAACCDDD